MGKVCDSLLIGVNLLHNRYYVTVRIAGNQSRGGRRGDTGYLDNSTTVEMGPVGLA